MTGSITSPEFANANSVKHRLNDSDVILSPKISALNDIVPDQSRRLTWDPPKVNKKISREVSQEDIVRN